MAKVLRRVLTRPPRRPGTPPLARELARDLPSSGSRVVTAFRAVRASATRAEAASILRMVAGLDAQRTAAVLNYRQSLIEEGLSPTRAQKAAARDAKVKLRERAVLMAQTETMKARNQGRLEAMRDAVEEGRAK